MQESKYQGTTLSHNWNMTNASNQMARNSAGAIAWVWRICSELGIKNRKHAMLWIFQVFALSAGLYGCQVWSTDTLTCKSSATNKPHTYCICLLKMLLGVRRSTNTHCLLRETGQLPLYFYWFRFVLPASGTAYWQPTMPCWARLMRLIAGTQKRKIG